MFESGDCIRRFDTVLCHRWITLWLSFPTSTANSLLPQWSWEESPRNIVYVTISFWAKILYHIWVYVNHNLKCGLLQIVRRYKIYGRNSLGTNIRTNRNVRRTNERPMLIQNWGFRGRSVLIKLLSSCCRAMADSKNQRYHISVLSAEYLVWWRRGGRQLIVKEVFECGSLSFQEIHAYEITIYINNHHPAMNGDVRQLMESRELILGKPVSGCHR